jgi:hypothetical protein
LKIAGGSDCQRGPLHRGHPLLDEYPFVPGADRSIPPECAQGDYPILGQHNFPTSCDRNLLLEARRYLNTPFESMNPNSEVFGDPDQFF